MKTKKIERIIEMLIHQNLMVVDKGTKEHPDYVVGGTNDLKRELVNLFLLHNVSDNEVTVCPECTAEAEYCEVLGLYKCKECDWEGQTER